MSTLKVPRKKAGSVVVITNLLRLPALTKLRKRRRPGRLPQCRYFSSTFNFYFLVVGSAGVTGTQQKWAFYDLSQSNGSLSTSYRNHHHTPHPDVWDKAPDPPCGH